MVIVTPGIKTVMNMEYTLYMNVYCIWKQVENVTGKTINQFHLNISSVINPNYDRVMF